MWYSKILVAYDGSAPADKAVEIASEMAESRQDARIVFAHVLKIADCGAGDFAVSQAICGDAKEISAKLEKLAAPFGERAEVRLLKGSSPASLIVRCCKEEGCDVIVMGSRGMGGVKGYLGSVSNAVLRESDVCVVIAKADRTERNR